MEPQAMEMTKHYNHIGSWEVLETSHNPPIGLSLELDNLFEGFVVQINVYHREGKDMSGSICSLDHLRGEITAYAEKRIHDWKMYRCIRLLAKQAIAFIDSHRELRVESGMVQ